MDAQLGIEVGEAAPDFTLLDTGGNSVSLSAFKGHKHVVLAFLRGFM
jgi:peroxiredoxin